MDLKRERDWVWENNWNTNVVGSTLVRFVLFSEAQFYGAKGGLKLMILLPPPPKCWGWLHQNTWFMWV